MKGATHILLTLLTLAAVLAPFAPDYMEHIETIPFLIVTFLAVFFGSITPDIDAGRGSAIFHSHIPGAKGKRFILTPVFGYGLCYTCYYPVRKIFHLIFGDKIYAKAGHRELPHSPLGCLCISALLTLYIWLIFAALSFIPPMSFLFNHPLIYGFGIAFFAGCLLHLIEDSCDNSGVHWFYPFSFTRLRGTLRGDGTDIKPRVYAVIMLCVAAGIITASFTGLIPENSRIIAAIFIPGLLWIIFLRLSGCPAKKVLRDNYRS
ncbi:MAG TPA: metal-dependent hydrolase [Methanocorpusculum sp.]|nr:metal-dependent hydrolase [Methanocorpusculum sp.]